MPPLVMQALLLRSHPYSESSRILRFLTPHHGVVAAIGRGVRSRGSRGGDSLELFARGSLTLDHRPGRDLQGFRAFDVEDPHRALPLSLVRFGGASFLGELALRHGTEEGNPALFEGIDQALSLLEVKNDAAAAALVIASGWRIMALLGYSPELDQCVVCGAPIPEGEVVRFDHGSGGVRGLECTPTTGPPPGPLVGPGTRNLLARMLKGDEPEGLPRVQVHLRLLHDFATWHMGQGRTMESFPFFAGRLAGLDPAGDPGEGGAG